MEMDAKYVQGMINNLDLQPSVTINQWIAGILLFSFCLIVDNKMRVVPNYRWMPVTHSIPKDS